MEFKLLTVKVCPVVTEPSVHPEVDGPERWVVIVALVAVPDELSVKVTSMLTRPHPVFPMRVACQGPARSALVMSPIVAPLGFTDDIKVSSESIAMNATCTGAVR